MKNKPIKSGFKWWHQCYNKTGYLYELDLYLGKKEKELGLGETVLLDLSKKVRKHILHAVFWQRFKLSNLSWETFS